MTLKSGAPKSLAVARVAATGAPSFSITKYDVMVGTVTFAAGAISGTFASDTVFEAGHQLGFVAPTAPNVTLAGISFALVLVHS